MKEEIGVTLSQAPPKYLELLRAVRGKEGLPLELRERVALMTP